jgi:hypothetical protein
LLHSLPVGAGETIRRKVDTLTPQRASFPTSIDLPLSDGSKRVLANAVDEAQGLAHDYIGTEHLLLGLLREEVGTAAAILREFGVNADKLRREFAEKPSEFPFHPTVAGRTIPADDIIQIHGASRDAAHIRSVVAQYQRHPWHWRQEVWLPRDVAAHLVSGEISFDLSLADDENFKLVKAGWTSDACVVCGWKLCKSPTLAHGSGYTNGQDWLCIECYEKFFANSRPGPPPHSEMT